MIEMDQESEQFAVRYEPQDDDVRFSSSSRSANCPSGQPKIRRRTCALNPSWKSVLLAFLINAGSTSIVVFLLVRSEVWSCREIADALPDLPEVKNLILEAITDRSFTVTWERPEGNFDYYLIYVSGSHRGHTENARDNIAGSCANGTIIPRDHTKVTCGHVDTCTNLNFGISTHVPGPPERTSVGVTLRGIFIPDEEPPPPTGITMVSLSHDETLLRWQSPAKLFGTLSGYSVQICDAFTHCDAHEDGHHCTEHNTTKPILKFESTADTAYCVFVFAIVRCGTDITSSSPAKKKIRTPLLAIPEVENLHLVSVLDKAVTLEWEKPRASFDYYRVDTTFAKDYQDKARIPKRVGSCDNGMIVPPDRNGVTCGYLEACTNVTFKVRTYRKGPPKLLSSGVILRNIFIPGQDLDSPTDINVESKTTASTVLRWKPPAKVQGILGEYKVKICNSYEACGPAEKMCDCTEYRTLSASIEVNETSVAYCVLVTATSQCGADILESRPFAKEVRMHSSDEVRTSSSQWVKWHGNTVPENALPGGQDSNHTMYICRATHKDQLTPGKYAPMNSVCYVSYAGSEHAYEKFEVLTIKGPPVLNC